MARIHIFERSLFIRIAEISAFGLGPLDLGSGGAKPNPTLQRKLAMKWQSRLRGNLGLLPLRRRDLCRALIMRVACLLARTRQKDSSSQPSRSISPGSSKTESVSLRHSQRVSSVCLCVCLEVWTFYNSARRRGWRLARDPACG